MMFVNMILHASFLYHSFVSWECYSYGWLLKHLIFLFFVWSRLCVPGRPGQPQGGSQGIRRYLVGNSWFFDPTSELQVTSYSWCKKSCNCWDRTRACKEWDLCHINWCLDFWSINRLCRSCLNMTSAQDVMLPKDADGKPQCQCIVQSSGSFLKFSSAHLSRRQVTKFQSFFFVIPWY